MPTYEYECQKCGHHYDLFQPMSAKPKRTCPKCGGRVKRLVGTGAGLLFKGSGFYITDYRKPGYKEAATKDSGASTAAASPTSTGKESAPTTTAKASASESKPSSSGGKESSSSPAKKPASDGKSSAKKD